MQDKETRTMQHEATMKNLPYKGKLTLVTGAGREGRVGAKIAHYFALHGSDILLHYRSDEAEARSVKDKIERDTGAAVRLVSGELSNVEDVRTLFTDVVPDMVINNAAVFKPAAEGSDPLGAAHAALEHNVVANLHAPLLVSAEAVRRLLKQRKRGVIVFVGDAFIERGGVYPAALTAYMASKAWIPSVVSQLAAAHGREGLRFLAVLNGPVEPPPSASARAIESIAQEINLPADALGPWIGGEGVAEAVHSLIQAGTVNGATVAVDGGRAWRAPSEHS